MKSLYAGAVPGALLVEMPVDRAAVFNPVQNDRLGPMIRPEQDTVIPHPKFMQPF